MEIKSNVPLVSNRLFLFWDEVKECLVMIRTYTNKEAK